MPLEMALLLGVTTRADKSDDYFVLRTWSLHTLLSEGYIKEIAKKAEQKINSHIDSVIDSVFINPNGINPVKMKANIWEKSIKNIESYVKTNEFKKYVKLIEASASDEIELDVPIGMLMEIVFNGDNSGDLPDLYRMKIRRELDLKNKTSQINNLISIKLEKTRKQLANKIGEDTVKSIENTIKETMFHLKSRYN